MLPAAEFRLPVPPEYLGYRHAGFFLNLLVHVHEPPPRQGGQPPPHRGFAAAHKAAKQDITHGIIT